LLTGAGSPFDDCFVLDVGACPVSLPPQEHKSVETSSAVAIRAGLTERYAARAAMNGS
jgi:hypothetical protein